MSENEGAALAAWSADVYARQPVKPCAVLLGPLARGCVTLLRGPRGVGKSWLALALAHTAARGGSLGRWHARKKHRVVFFDCAGSEAVLHRRLLALGEPPPALVIVPGDAQSGGLPDLSSDSGRQAVDELVTDADLVVIDGVSALVRKGRGVGTRWAALEDWLRALRRHHTAVLLVDTREPPLADLADTALILERPADGVAEGDLRVQAKRVASRPGSETQRFALTMRLRPSGAAWSHVDDVDHRAIVAYRLEQADYSTREIARLLEVSPATAWRLATRGARLPKHVRDGVDLDVPLPPRLGKKRDWKKILRLSLPPTGGKEGPAAKQREDEGESTQESIVTAETAPAADTAPSALRAPPHLNPLPVGERTSEGPLVQTPQTGEALKQRDARARAARLWRTPLHELMKERGHGGV